MCGICGYVASKLISDQELNDMNNTMIRRGPDDHGIWSFWNGEKAIGFAQRRLSIRDISPLGHQPMINKSEDLIIVFNGEIYNFIELRKELQLNGYSFISQCDTEVLLYAYAEWHDEMLQKINGMFAFAIYDKVNNRILMARDRMGEKPLYYYSNGNTFIFGSELKPIMKHPEFKKEINEDVLLEYLCNKAIVAPNCIFKNTYKVPAGNKVVIDKNGITMLPYWNLWERYNAGLNDTINDFEKSKNSLKELLYDSVERKLNADVPVGVFLSAGIDSSLITAVATRVSKERIRTYTIGFEEKERNEAPRARSIAEYLGTEHHELYINDEDILNMVHEIPNAYDEPFSDASQMPTLLLSKLTREDVTVALGGDGGDELFCGYSMYDWLWYIQRMDKITGGVREALNLPLLNKIPWNEMLPKTAVTLLNNTDPNTKVQCFIDLKRNVASKIIYNKNHTEKYTTESELLAKNWQTRRMLLDMCTYLPDEVLNKVDRASMYYSLETRAPLLDHNIVEFSFRLPHRYKYHNGEKKYILKQIAYDYIPKEMLNMPKKGFGVPIAKWLCGPLRQQLMNYADKDRLKQQGIFDPDEVNELCNLVKKNTSTIYTTVLWGFFCFQMWYEKYIEN
ncbi:MAG: asparagine synthase (glutamine-hydrolyzing) [Lachnospiraceae bacterium]|nr:asparagine synthase (glutamine-hydrolyzing) [Lachnospiraceae bacterium]